MATNRPALHLTPALLALALHAAVATATAAPAIPPFPTLESLGEALFHDTNLSLNRTQACATCHVPSAAFTDPRDSGARGAVSVGDDGVALGTRNSPTLLYALYAPPFHQMAPDVFRGGQFHDGRARSLPHQVNLNGGPFLNPGEMMMPSRSAVVERVLENPDYVAALQRFFGPQILSREQPLFSRLGHAIAAFERSEAFHPFSSKYDAVLAGEAAFSPLEQAGHDLFHSADAGCSGCHDSTAITGPGIQTFTDYRYYNLGVPANETLNALRPDASPDRGLAGHPLLGPEADQQLGRFKVPTLRNVAVTAPYLHNGVADELETVLQLHNFRGAPDGSLADRNPETGLPWAGTDYPERVDRDALALPDALSDAEIEALIAFLHTLTDSAFLQAQDPATVAAR